MFVGFTVAVGRRREWEGAGEHDVDHHTQGPAISDIAIVVLTSVLGIEHFGRAIARGPNDFATLADGARKNLAVGILDVLFRQSDDILWRGPRGQP